MSGPPRRWHGTGRWILLALVVGALGSWAWLRGVGAADRPETMAGDQPAVERLVPPGTRIVVAALNGTTTRGLARRATRALRDAGFDVVASGNAEAPTDSSVVYVHAGDSLWAQWAARAIGGARIVTRPDASRDLHLTVVVGRAWRPPADPFDP
ncbi:MAG: LytR C-terminal domain-containing protein [Gemmatimonadota bacterium]